LVVIAKKSQLSLITKTVKKIDNKSFLSVSQVMSVYGEGFDKIKGGEKIEWKSLKKFSKS
jgi:uncharacterized membrane-anchored protein YitT (DUF2179 family)